MEYSISQIAFEFKQTMYFRKSLYTLKYKKIISRDVKNLKAKIAA